MIHDFAIGDLVEWDMSRRRTPGCGRSRARGDGGWTVSPDEKHARIPVLWFDRKGCGPDELVLQIRPVPSDLDGAIPESLAIMARAGGLVIGAAPMVDGGFNLGREQVTDLHRQLGAWLEATPCQK